MSKEAKTSKRTSKVQNTSTFQYLILLIVLSILNISFFFGYSGSSAHLQCSADTVIEVISLYLANNGRTTLNGLIPAECNGFGENAEKDLKTSIRHLLSECEREKKEIERFNATKPHLTLFTTFADHNHTDLEKDIVHKNTLRNWAALKPFVNLILFSNDTSWTIVAKSMGWEVIKPRDEENGLKPPILKNMFRAAMDRYKTVWYGYVNADILFTRDLILNLETFTRKYDTRNSSLLLTGRRTNVNNLTALDALSDKKINEHAKLYGELYKEDAEDFFFTTKSFPWDRILPVVVGRPAYDNWLVGEARCHLNTTVVDVTETLLAFHQTTKKGGNNEGHLHPNSDYNFKVLKDNKVVFNFLSGLTDCIIYNTYRTFCGDIGINQRTNFGPNCKCK